MPPMLIEAIYSVAMDHRDGCQCPVCLAACGDLAALEVVMTVALGQEQLDELAGL